VQYTSCAHLILLTQDLGIPGNASDAVIENLIKTYPFYNDRASRQAVQQCLRSLIANPCYSDSAGNLLKAFKRETSKAGIAASSAFVLVEWGSEFIQQCAAQEKLWEAYGLELILHHAQILERCLSSKCRSSVKQSALVVTRRALRRLFRATRTGETAVKEIVVRLTAKPQGGGPTNAVLLGVVAGVCARLESIRPTLEANKSLYYSFYVREIIGSRSIVPQHIVAAYNDFFANFATQEDVQKEVVPAFDKALLRAPEVVLNDLISPMVRSLPSNIDLSESLAAHLLKPFLANLKSQSSIIRNGTMSAFTACVNHSYDDTYLKNVTDDILNPLASSKLTVAEQRTLHSQMLLNVPYHETRSAAICTSLAAITAKESNETALSVEIAALSQHLSPLLGTAGAIAQGSLGTWTDAFTDGLGDRRPAVRKIWILRTGDLVWRLKTESADSRAASNVIDAMAPKLLDCFDEVIANLQSSVQSGLSVTAYVVVAIYDFLTAHTNSEQVRTQGRKSNVYHQAFATNQKSSILNHRVYSKLSGDDEIRWAIRALSAKEFPDVDSDGDNWALAFSYFITAANIPPALRKEATGALHEVYYTQPSKVPYFIIRGLWTWYSQVEHSIKDTPAAAAKTGNSNLYLVVRSIFPPRSKASNPSRHIDVEILRSELVDMLVLARPEIIPRVSWIDLCLEVGQDPGDLARSSVDRIMQTLDVDHPSAAVNLAKCQAAAELAFVSPDAITPILVTQIQDDLNAEKVGQYGPTEIAMARTPEGTAFVDVLGTKTSGRGLDKNTRDYETLRWEEEVRSQQARRTGQEKKLTADEKAKVKSQLAKEANVRKEVLETERRLKKGIGFIHALATGPPTEADLWMGPCLKALLGVIATGAGLMVGNEANEAYIACSNLVSSRLGSLRSFIGVATLRSLESTQLPESLIEEPLGGT